MARGPAYQPITAGIGNVERESSKDSLNDDLVFNA